MVLKREYKGIEGYFYNSGNKKLIVEPGVIDKVWYDAPGRNGFFNLGISKHSRRSFCFCLEDEKDIASLFSDLGVSSIKQLMRLPVQERLVLAYRNGIQNYGISLARRN